MKFQQINSMNLSLITIGSIERIERFDLFIKFYPFFIEIKKKSINLFFFILK